MKFYPSALSSSSLLFFYLLSASSIAFASEGSKKKKSSPAAGESFDCHEFLSDKFQIPGLKNLPPGPEFDSLCEWAKRAADSSSQRHLDTSKLLNYIKNNRLLPSEFTEKLLVAIINAFGEWYPDFQDREFCRYASDAITNSKGCELFLRANNLVNFFGIRTLEFDSEDVDEIVAFLANWNTIDHKAFVKLFNSNYLPWTKELFEKALMNPNFTFPSDLELSKEFWELVRSTSDRPLMELIDVKLSHFPDHACGDY